VRPALWHEGVVTIRCGRRQALSRAIAIPWPTPMHIVARARFPPDAFISSAAVRVDARIIVGNAKIAQTRQPLRGKGLVQLDHIEVRLHEAEPAHQFIAGRRRAKAYDPRCDACGRAAEDTGKRGEPVGLDGGGRRQDQSRGTVVDAGGIAGGDTAAVTERRAQLCELFQRGRRAGMLVLRDNHRIGFALRDRHQRDLLREAPAGLRARPLLASGGQKHPGLHKRYWVFGHVLGGLGHGMAS